MKKAPTLIFILLTAGFSVFGQSERNRVNVNAGPSWHGTGDLGGLSVSLMHEHDFSRRTAISNGLNTTIHYGKHRGFNDLFPGAFPEVSPLHLQSLLSVKKSF